MPLPASLIVDLARAVDRIHYVKLEEPPVPAKISQIRRLGGQGPGIFGGMGGQHFLEERRRGALGTMTGFAYPEVLVAVQAEPEAGRRRDAALLFHRYLPLIRYEGHVGIGLALRKKILRWRGAIRSTAIRAPGMRLDRDSRKEPYDLPALLELGPAFPG